MKKWGKVLGVLGLSMLFLGGCSGDDDSTTLHQVLSEDSSSEEQLPETGGVQSFLTDEGEIVNVKVPEGWRMYDDPEELGDGTNASFEIDNEEAYAALTMYTAIDYESFEIFLEATLEVFEIPDDVEVTPIDTGLFKGNRYTFEESNGLTKIKYDAYIMQGEDYFLNAQVWSLPSKAAGLSDDLEDLVHSLSFEG